VQKGTDIHKYLEIMATRSAGAVGSYLGEIDAGGQREDPQGQL